jgi:hypothetical protein
MPGSRTVALLIYAGADRWKSRFGRDDKLGF